MTIATIRRAWAAALVLALAAFGAHAHDPDAEAKADRISERDVEFARQAARINLAEIALGELALEKGTHAEVQQFASRMVADHRRANRELESITRGRVSRLPAVFSEDAREKIVDLNERVGPAFDREYMDHMLDKQREEVEFYREYVEEGENAALRNYANEMKRTLQAHENAALATRDVVLRSERSGERETGSRR